jgi:hypothetical protein
VEIVVSATTSLAIFTDAILSGSHRLRTRVIGMERQMRTPAVLADAIPHPAMQHAEGHVTHLWVGTR